MAQSTKLILSNWGVEDAWDEMGERSSPQRIWASKTADIGLVAAEPGSQFHFDPSQPV